MKLERATGPEGRSCEYTQKAYNFVVITNNRKCFMIRNLECRARPNLPEIRLFWTSTWGEEDRVLVDLDPSPSAVEARRLGAKHSGDFILKVQANGIISSLISIYQINHYWMLNPSVKLNFQK